MEFVNESGQGRSASVPAEIKKWNWGAFWLPWIWGIYHNTWISLLCFVPYVNIIFTFILAAKGSEWAWQNKHYESLEQFKNSQRKWGIWGISIMGSLIILSFLAGLLYGMLSYGSVNI